MLSTMYRNIDDLKSAVNRKENCHIIMSRWNAPITKGLHTFYVKKTGSEYKAYNKYENNIGTSLDIFNDGDGFIVGYILW